MERMTIFLLFISIPFISSLEFGIGSDFFQDFDLDGEDKQTRSSFFDDGDQETESDTVFVSESTNTLKDGREMVTRESEAWTTDPKTGKPIKKKVSKHFIRYQNGTVFQVDNQGSGEDESNVQQSSAVECITEEDCKDTYFCDRLSFSCKACLKANQTCHKHSQCCEGYLCRDGKCSAITGKENDPCNEDKDCKDNHCCAYENGNDVCRPYLEEGDTCGDQTFLSPRFPSYFSRKFIENSRRSKCPCLKGLECKKEQDSYFLMEPKTCTRVSKKAPHQKAIKQKKKKSRQEKREEMEHQDEINETEEREEEHDHDDNHDDDDNVDDDDDDEEENQSIIDRVPKFLRGLFESIFD